MAGYDDLMYEILRFVAASEVPCGAGTIYFGIEPPASRPSAPTIGRRLRELEERRLLKKVSVEGRTITDAGRRALESLEGERRLRTAGEAVLGALRMGSSDDVVDLLIARRPLERETARLAALHATPAEMEIMQRAVDEQEAEIERGGLGADADIRFHDALAKAGGNEYLAVLVSLLRHHGRYADLINRIRVMSGRRSGLDHRAAVDAIKRRDPVAAEAAMDAHIGQLIDEVSTYWPLVKQRSVR